MRATVTKIDNSTGIILPKEVAARLSISPEGYSVIPDH